MYLVAGLARNQDYLRDSLAQSVLTPAGQNIVMAALGALLAVSAILILLHIGRFLLRPRGARGPSGPLLGGVLGALAVIYTPPGMVDFGLTLIDDNSRSLLSAANGKVEDTMGISLEKVAFVTALNR
ncbi:hypothetical protein [Roseivivax sp. CAU 1761]